MEFTDVLRALESRAEDTVRRCIGRFGYPHDVFIPDAKGCYPAFWQRDFGYALEYMPECFETDMIVACCEDILANVRPSDGWAADRFYPDGSVIYAAGDPGRICGHDCLDTAAFITRTVNCVLTRLGVRTDAAKSFYLRWRAVLARAIYAMPVDGETGLVSNDPLYPHTVFGFTDTVCKTGLLCMESLDLWRAYRILDGLETAYGYGDGGFAAGAEKIEGSLERVFYRGALLDAATLDCAQPDIWASAYAVSQGFPLSDKAKKSIAGWLAENFESYMWRGLCAAQPRGDDVAALPRRIYARAGRIYERRILAGRLRLDRGDTRGGIPRACGAYIPRACRLRSRGMLLGMCQ